MTRSKSITRCIAALAVLAILFTSCTNKGSVPKEDEKKANESKTVETTTEINKEEVKAPEKKTDKVTDSSGDKNDAKNDTYLILSQKHGFSLEAPLSWENKVIIKEDDKGLTIAHKTISPKAMAKDPVFLTIVEFGSEEEWEQESKKTDQPFPYEKLGVVNGKVFARVQLLDFPYSDEDKDDKDEFNKILSETEEVLKSFKAIK